MILNDGNYKENDKGLYYFRRVLRFMEVLFIRIKLNLKRLPPMSFFCIGFVIGCGIMVLGSQYSVVFKDGVTVRKVIDGQRHSNPSPVAICAIQKGALFYMDEWVDYHLALGFDTIFIYDNSDNFELNEWAISKGPGAPIVVRHFPGEVVQKRAYEDCFNRIKDHDWHDWVAFIDADEFIVPKQHDTISELLATVPENAGGLTISWFMFGTSGHEKYAAIPALKRFQFRQKYAHELNKTIGRTSKMISPFYHNHFYKDGIQSVDTDGTPVKGHWFHFKGPTDVAVIHHYRTKSWEEFRSKCKRGRATQKHADIKAEAYQPCKEGLTMNDIANLSEVYDDSAWRLLTKNVPSYAKYDL